MWVIKLGGSLLGSEELQGWLDVVERLGDGKVVIVPGGGVFADAVRVAQERSKIDDTVSHRMAVMAMDQFGVLMTGLNPKLVTASTELELAERGWQHRGIVWLPSHMVCTDEDIPMNWEVTSDSLAAWLANKLEALHLVIVKSQQPDGEVKTADDLAEEGVVDSSLSTFIRDTPFKTWIIDKRKHSLFSRHISPTILEEHALSIVPA